MLLLIFVCILFGLLYMFMSVLMFWVFVFVLVLTFRSGSSADEQAGPYVIADSAINIKSAGAMIADCVVVWAHVVQYAHSLAQHCISLSG